MIPTKKQLLAVNLVEHHDNEYSALIQLHLYQGISVLGQELLARGSTLSQVLSLFNLKLFKIEDKEHWAFILAESPSSAVTTYEDDLLGYDDDLNEYAKGSPALICTEVETLEDTVLNAYRVPLSWLSIATACKMMNPDFSSTDYSVLDTSHWG